MKINTDINILGGLPDFDLILHFLKEKDAVSMANEPSHTYTALKTTRSIERFERAIRDTFLSFKNTDLESLVSSILMAEGISTDSILILFWNSALNNDLLNYLNEHAYFPSFYSGRISIKADEIVACLKDLRESEPELQNWSDSTLKRTASKYLTLLKKFNLMEGSLNKTISHPYLNDKMFVHFVYWITASETKSNIFESEKLKYCFSERPVFIERLMQKKFSKYYQFHYTGDKLKIEPLIPYSTIYHAIK